MVVGVALLGAVGEQSADFAGGEPDQVLVVVITLLRCRGKLSSGAGAPFESR
jgi:hypothetical protein